LTDLRSYGVLQVLKSLMKFNEGVLYWRSAAGQGSLFDLVMRFSPVKDRFRCSIESLSLWLLVCAVAACGSGNLGASVPVSTPPTVVFQQRPVYPESMRASGMRGEVVVDFIVDREGRVRDPVVRRSLNPAFDVPAIEALRKWRFVPGMRAGQPVDTLMQVPVIFTLNETANGGQDPLVRRQVGDPASLPESFRYDTPPAARGTVRPVYPYTLLLARVTGKSSVRYIVGPDGKVSQTLVGDTSHSEFGLALQAALECFEFSPALREGKPVPAIEGFTQEFRLDSDLQIVSDEDLELVKRERREGAQLGKHTNLDRVPRPISRRSPVYPLSVDQELNEGQAVIEFLIDETGKARLPRTVSASQEAFGYSAVQAVSQWLFEPPTVGGRPVLARMQVPFEFKRPQLAKAGPAPKVASESPRAQATEPGAREMQANSVSRDATLPPSGQGQSGSRVPPVHAQGAVEGKSVAVPSSRNEAEVQVQLAEALLREDGFPSDSREYVRLLRLASDQAHPKAMYRLGLAFRDGLGVPVDRVWAHCWLNLASAAGEPGARQQLAAIDGQLTPEQRAEAEKMARDKWDTLSALRGR
jgi:TonB family protein